VISRPITMCDTLTTLFPELVDRAVIVKVNRLFRF